MLAEDISSSTTTITEIPKICFKNLAVTESSLQVQKKSFLIITCGLLLMCGGY